MGGYQLSNVAYKLAEENHEWSIALVKKIARNSGLKLSEMEELKSAGVYGLIEAAQRYTPNKNVQFKSYAFKRIYGALIDHVRRNTKDIRSISKLKNFNIINFSQSHQSDLEFEKEKEKVNNHRKYKKSKITLTDVQESSISQWNLQSSTHNTLENMINKEELGNLKNALAELPYQQRELIIRHYINGEDFYQITKDWGTFSKSWASKLHHKALYNLKNILLKQGNKNEVAGQNILYSEIKESLSKAKFKKKKLSKKIDLFKEDSL